jgi:hypothetical protein
MERATGIESARAHRGRAWMQLLSANRTRTEIFILPCSSLRERHGAQQRFGLAQLSPSLKKPVGAHRKPYRIAPTLDLYMD